MIVIQKVIQKLSNDAHLIEYGEHDYDIETDQ